MATTKKTPADPIVKLRQSGLQEILDRINAVDERHAGEIVNLQAELAAAKTFFQKSVLSEDERDRLRKKLVDIEGAVNQQAVEWDNAEEQAARFMRETKERLASLEARSTTALRELVQNLDVKVVGLAHGVENRRQEIMAIAGSVKKLDDDFLGRHKAMNDRLDVAMGFARGQVNAMTLAAAIGCCVATASLIVSIYAIFG